MKNTHYHTSEHYYADWRTSKIMKNTLYVFMLCCVFFLFSNNALSYSLNPSSSSVNMPVADTCVLVSTVAGNGTAGYVDGAGDIAQFMGPYKLDIDAAGNIYVADYSSHIIRKINPAGVVSTLAGTPGVSGWVDGAGAAAQFSYPADVDVDAAGNVFVVDQVGHRVRKIDPMGNVTTIAGNGTAGLTDANGLNAQFNYPSGITVDAAGNLYIADQFNHRIRKIDSAGEVTTLAGTGMFGGYVDGGVATAEFNRPVGIAIDNAGNLYVADNGNNRIRKIDTNNMVSSIFSVSLPPDVDVDASGNIYIVDPNNACIRKIDPMGNVSIAAGTCAPSDAGYLDGAAETAMFSTPNGLAVDGTGDVFVADLGNYRIRKIDVMAPCCVLSVTCPATTNFPLSCVEELPTTNDPAGAFAAIGGSVNTSCSPVNISVIDTVEDGMGCTNDLVNIVRTFNVADVASLENISCTVNYVIRDTIAPLWLDNSGALDASFVCASDFVMPALPRAMDNCGNSSVNVILNSDVVVPGACSNSYVRMLSYIAMDACGNQSVPYVVTLTVADNIAPVWDQSPGVLDANFTCGEGVSVAVEPTATDNCDNIGPLFNSSITVSLISDTTTPGACSNSYVRTLNYVAADACGNQSVPYTVTLAVEDNTAPVWNQLPGTLDANFTCDEEVFIAAEPTATDNCGNLDLAFNSSITVSLISDITTPGTCSNSYVRTLSYIATDACGNQSTPYTVTLTIDDNVAPVWDQTQGALDVTFASAEDVVLPATPTATDNCAEASATITLESDTTIPGICSNNFTRILSYLATDACGNQSPYTVTITVADPTQPVFSSCPGSPLFLSCDGDNTAIINFWLGNVTATNPDGSAVTVSNNFDAGNLFPSCGNGAGLIITFTATNACGNEAYCYGQITLQDIGKPTIVCPDDTTIECGESIDPAFTGQATAMDNCSAFSVSYSDVISASGCANNNTIARTWRATDACGNQSTCLQTITIEDTTPPILSVLPADVTVNCEDGLPVDPGITAIDNCGEVLTVTYTPATMCTYGLIVTNTWSVADCSGNITTHTQNIAIVDNVPPNVICQDASIVLDDTGTAFIMAEMIDAGSSDPSGISHMYVEPAMITCPGAGAVEVTLFVVDNEGNVGQCAATVGVVDNVGSDLVCKNFVTTLPPEGVVTISGADVIASVTDNCGISSIALSEDTFTEAGVYTVIVSVINNNGNVTSCEATVEIFGTTNCQETLYVNNSILSGVYQAWNMIISAGDVLHTEVVDYKAGGEINLLPGFEVELGAEFSATIEDCPTQSKVAPEENKKEQVAKE